MMDNFIDKIAQKIGSGDLIRANSSAEARELKRTKEKLEEYETLIQQMRQVHLKNVELLGRMQQTVDTLEELEDGFAGEDDQVKGTDPMVLEEISGLKEQIDSLKTSLKDTVTEISEVVHAEDVKVFRNVEAVVEEEAVKCIEAVKEESVNIRIRMRGVKPLAITTLVIVILQFLASAAVAANYIFDLQLF